MAFKFIPHRWFLWLSLPFIVLQIIFSIVWSTPSVTLPFHDTYFVISQSMICMMLAAFMIFIAVIYFIMMKMQRRLHRGLSKIHFATTLISVIVLIFGMVFSGFFTISSSENVDEVLFDFISLKKAIAFSAFLLIFSQILFVLNCLAGIFNLRFFKT